MSGGDKYNKAEYQYPFQKLPVKPLFFRQVSSIMEETIQTILFWRKSHVHLLGSDQSKFV
jgi:hypothetical protein